MSNCYVVCYNRLDVFTSRENAIKFYRPCYYGSEGCERERYAHILIDLTFRNLGFDNVDSTIWEICYFDETNKVIRKEKIEHTDYKKVIEKLESEVK